MMKKFKGILLVAILVAFDQITKILAKTHLAGGNDVVIWKNIFRLQYHENAGAVWGIMQGRIIFLALITLVILAGIIFIYRKMPQTKKYTPMKIVLLFISAGAIGNFIDRIVYHYVVDFLYFELIDFPIFNVADCYVSVSVVFMIFLVLFYYKDEDFDFLSKGKKHE